MKKASKPSGKPCQSAQEECGVWLDTVQLKGKLKLKQKQRVRRPISKLLNPSLGGGGYSVAVALNFTQTKSPMPNTKQSSISSFFSPQSRVPNKTATSELANRDVVDSSTTSSSSFSSSSSSSTSVGFASASPAPVEFGTKRKHEPDPEVLAFLDRETKEHPARVVDYRGEVVARCHWGGDGVTENEAPVSLSHDEIHLFGADLDHEYEDGELETKRRLSDTSSPRTETEPGGGDPGRSSAHGRCSQYSPIRTAHDERIPDSDIQFSPAHEEHPTAAAREEGGVCGTAFLESLRSEEAFRVWLGAGGEARTSTQKPRLASQKDEEKENRRSSSSSTPLALESPNERSSLSAPRSRPPLGNRTFTRTSARSPPPPPSPPPGRPWKRAREDDDDGRGLASLYKRPTAPPRSSPLKKAPPSPLQEEDSLAMLFTQDSEGFRVIAHRGPLKDHTNLPGGAEKRTLSLKAFEEEEEEEEDLFTQDSQGNRVIKH